MGKEQKIEYESKKEKQLKKSEIEKYNIKKPFLLLFLPYLFSIIYVICLGYFYFESIKLEGYFFLGLLILIPSLIIFSLNDDWNKEFNFRKLIQKDLKYKFEYKEGYYYTDSLKEYCLYWISSKVLILAHFLPILYYGINFVFSSFETLLITLLSAIFILLLMIYFKLKK